MLQLSLRENPLVVRFVQDISLTPPTLMELAARTVRSAALEYTEEEMPNTLVDYLQSAHCCVNPKCSGKSLIHLRSLLNNKKNYAHFPFSGVFFDNRVEHIKFVDFCGKYRVPLLQYLCSSKYVCISKICSLFKTCR